MELKGEPSPSLEPPEDYGASERDPNLILPIELCDECKELGYCKDDRLFNEGKLDSYIVCGCVAPF